jgi:transcriptional regulator with GAF, ATPase, and Fis domain
MTQRRNDDETRIIFIPGAAERLLYRKLRLEVTGGVDVGASALVESKVLHVGTQAGNSLRLSDDTVSGIHFEVRNTKDGLRLRDLGSTNGTWVDAVRVFEAVIPAGTVVSAGHSKVRIDALDEQVSEPLSSSSRFGLLLGQSEAMRSLFSLLERAAPTDETVLITGETGTGKEVCARSIVAASLRKDRPFVVVDCGAIPPSLLESELFGHARGAFTGAVAEHFGAFERAQGGTIFLDEIGELPLELQTRLLRAVENRQIRRVGDGREIPLDIRILAATNRCLEEEVNRGTFRADLYYRLSVLQVRLPPLRERPDDIDMLSRHLLGELKAGTGAVALTEPLLEQLRRLPWPGLRRVALGEPHVRLEVEAGPPVPSQDVLKIDLSLPFKDCKTMAVDRFERAYLQILMKEAAGNVSKAARIAQTDRTYLSRLLVKHRITGG